MSSTSPHLILDAPADRPAPRTTTYAATRAPAATSCRAPTTSPPSPARWAHEAVLASDAVGRRRPVVPGGAAAPRLETAAAAVAQSGPAGVHASPSGSWPGSSPTRTAPALLSLVRLPQWDPARVLTADARLVLVADGIEYAGNLGTLRPHRGRVRRRRRSC